MLFGYLGGYTLVLGLVVLGGLIVGLSLLSVLGRAVRRWAEPEWVARTGGRVEYGAVGLLFLVLSLLLLSIPFLLVVLLSR